MKPFPAIGIAAFSMTICYAQAPTKIETQKAIDVFAKIRETAEKGVIVTYRTVNSDESVRILSRYYSKGPYQRLDMVYYEVKQGKEETSYGSTSIQTIKPDGTIEFAEGTYQGIEGLDPQIVLNRINSQDQPRIFNSGKRATDKLFSHLAWRYGRDETGWIFDRIAKAKNLEVKQIGDSLRLSYEIGSSNKAHIVVTDQGTPRITKRSGRPKPEAETALLGFDFMESSADKLVFTHTSDYSQLSEEFLRRHDTPDYKLPRGRDEFRSDYNIVSEEFGPIDSKLFDYDQVRKLSSAAGRKAAASAAFAGMSSSPEQKGPPWFRIGIAAALLLGAGATVALRLRSKGKLPRS